MKGVQKKLSTKSKRAKMEQQRKLINFPCITLIVAVVVSIFYFVTGKGLTTFFKDKINMFDFLFGTNWSPSDIGADGKPMVGVLPMIVGSFIATFLSTIITVPLAIGAVAFMTGISPEKGAKFLQPVTGLLVGIPSAAYGFTGLSVIVPFVRLIFGGTGFSILVGTSVLFVMVLLTVTTMTVDVLKAVSRYYRETSLAFGVTRQQTIYKVVLRAAMPDILTVIVSGMARMLGEALAIQIVVGNVVMMPTSLTTSASTLTSILAMGIGDTIMGIVENNVLWFLVLILLLMPLLFNIVIQVIGKRGALE